MSDGKLVHGQQYDPSRGVVTQYTQRVHDYDRDGETGIEGQSATEITPMDGNAAQVRTYTTIDYTDYNDALTLKWNDTIQVQFPDTLTSITGMFNKTKGEGSYDETGTGAAVGTSAALSMGLNASANASISLVPDLTFNITQIWAPNVVCTHCVFYMEHPTDGDMNDTNVLAALTAIMGASVSAWPVFKPQTHVFSLAGKQMNLNVRCNIQQSVNLSSTSASASKSEGSGASYDTGVTTKSVTVGPVIHGALSISPATSTDTIQASASVDWPAGTNWLAQDADATLESDDITASITPSSLSATSPSSIPTSGIYRYHSDMTHFIDDVVQVHAVVVNFAQFA